MRNNFGLSGIPRDTHRRPCPVLREVRAPDASAHVIDWGFPAAAAPWVDAAYLILRLIEAGHTPVGAEAWARGLPCFRRVDSEALTAFAVHIAGMWTHWADHDPEPGKVHRAELARGYAWWRLSR